MGQTACMLEGLPWNFLPTDLKLISHQHHFKPKLKHFLKLSIQAFKTGVLLENLKTPNGKFLKDDDSDVI